MMIGSLMLLYLFLAGVHAGGKGNKNHAIIQHWDFRKHEPCSQEWVVQEDLYTQRQRKPMADRMYTIHCVKNIALMQILGAARVPGLQQAWFTFPNDKVKGVLLFKQAGPVLEPILYLERDPDIPRTVWQGVTIPEGQQYPATNYIAVQDWPEVLNGLSNLMQFDMTTTEEPYLTFPIKTEWAHLRIPVRRMAAYYDAVQGVEMNQEEMPTHQQQNRPGTSGGGNPIDISANILDDFREEVRRIRADKEPIVSVEAVRDINTRIALYIQDEHEHVLNSIQKWTTENKVVHQKDINDFRRNYRTSKGERLPNVEGETRLRKPYGTQSRGRKNRQRQLPISNAQDESLGVMRQRPRKGGRRKGLEITQDEVDQVTAQRVPNELSGGLGEVRKMVKGDDVGINDFVRHATLDERQQGFELLRDEKAIKEEDHSDFLTNVDFLQDWMNKGENDIEKDDEIRDFFESFLGNYRL